MAGRAGTCAEVVSHHSGSDNACGGAASSNEAYYTPGSFLSTSSSDSSRMRCDQSMPMSEPNPLSVSSLTNGDAHVKEDYDHTNEEDGPGDSCCANGVGEVSWQRCGRRPNPPIAATKRN